jgi:hypothetical protein
VEGVHYVKGGNILEYLVKEKCIVKAKAQPPNFVGNTNLVTQAKNKDITSLGNLQT